MTVLITGAYGFVGTNLSAFLAERGHELWALDVEGGNKDGEASRQDAKTPRGAYARRFTWNELEEIPWGEVEAVVHLAGKAHDTRNASDPQSYFDVNVGLTKKVMRSAMGGWQSAVGNRRQATGTDEAGKGSSIPASQQSVPSGKKVILFSSVKAVADRVAGVLTEEAVPEPKTPYGQSKLEAEKEVRTVENANVGGLKDSRARTDNFRTLELPNFRTYILRPCMIHGPGNKGNLNLLYGMVRKGVPWPLGAFQNRRSFASIGNVCAVVEGLLSRDAASGVYQVADDEALSTNELIGIMAESLGRKARIVKVPAGLVGLVARLGDVLRLPLNSERLKKLTESYVVSNAKVKKALAWTTMPVSAREGMRKTLDSFTRPTL